MLTAIQSPKAAINHWLGVCRDHELIRGQMKVAELGGGQDTPFEQAFSNLAHAYIKDKAPKLLDFEVGFQLLEKNQENTKAVGVFGFKIGSQWVYVPVFFLNGDLKGHELMYIKSQDQFLPLKENWINHILGKKPSVLGDGVNRNLSQLGIMPPNLYQLSRSPYKFAAAMKGYHCEKCDCDFENEDGKCPNCGAAIKAAQHAPKTVVRRAHTEPDPDAGAPAGGEVVRVSHDEADPNTDGEDISPEKTGGLKIATWARDFLPVLGYLTMISPERKYQNMKGFSDLVKEGGEDTLRFVVQEVGNRYPAVIQGIDRIYGPELLTEAARKVAAQKRAAARPSLVKEAVVSSAGEHPPGWNGGVRPPTKENGGVTSFGATAWDSAQDTDLGKGTRRFDKKHGGAWKGKAEDMYKHSHYPGCKGYSPRRPKKMKKKAVEKAASIIPSILGPLVAGDLKHKVVSKETVDNDPNIVHSLKSDERETLLKERIVFSDKREGKDVTIAYDVQTPLKLYNPDHTGIYYVLARPDKFVKCLVIMAPYSSKQRHNFCTVVRLDGQKAYTNTHSINVWARAEVDRDEWTRWLKTQPDADNIPLAPREERWKNRTRYVLLGPSGQGTCPFEATEKYTGNKNESVVYDVDWEDHNYSSRPAYLPDHNERYKDPYMHGSPHFGAKQLVLTKRPGIKMTCLRCQLLVPGEFKMIKVRDEEGASESNNEPLQLGNLLDAQMAIMANTQPLRIVMDGSDVTVDENRMDKTSALVHLFRDHGLSEKAARHLLKQAEKKGRIECRMAYPEYIQAQWDETDNKEAGWREALGHGLSFLGAVGGGPAGPNPALPDPAEVAKQHLIRPQAVHTAPVVPGSRKSTPLTPMKTALDESARFMKGKGLHIGKVEGDLKVKFKHEDGEKANHMAIEPGKIPASPMPRPGPGNPPGTMQHASKQMSKKADNDMISGAPNAPPFPEPYWSYDPMTGGNVPTMMPSEFNQKIPDMSASKTDRTIYYPFGPDPKAMQVAQQASQTGQREVFDTAMLGGLLKAVRQDNIVDKYMGDLKKGLDRLGRILFLLYWHGEEFEDRYGKADMPELEDGLRNGFENVGDIVLELMKKTIGAQPDEGTGVDLSAIANQ